METLPGIHQNLTDAALQFPQEKGKTERFTREKQVRIVSKGGVIILITGELIRAEKSADKMRCFFCDVII